MKIREKSIVETTHALYLNTMSDLVSFLEALSTEELTELRKTLQNEYSFGKCSGWRALISDAIKYPYWEE